MNKYIKDNTKLTRVFTRNDLEGLHRRLSSIRMAVEHVKEIERELKKEIKGDRLTFDDFIFCSQ